MPPKNPKGKEPLLETPKPATKGRGRPKTKETEITPPKSKTLEGDKYYIQLVRNQKKKPITEAFKDARGEEVGKKVNTKRAIYTFIEQNGKKKFVSNTNLNNLIKSNARIKILPLQATAPTAWGQKLSDYLHKNFINFDIESFLKERPDSFIYIDEVQTTGKMQTDLVFEYLAHPKTGEKIQKLDQFENALSDAGLITKQQEGLATLEKASEQTGGTFRGLEALAKAGNIPRNPQASKQQTKSPLTAEESLFEDVETSTGGASGLYYKFMPTGSEKTEGEIAEAGLQQEMIEHGVRGEVMFMGYYNKMNPLTKLPQTSLFCPFLNVNI
jgi:hypothetical protein